MTTCPLIGDDLIAACGLVLECYDRPTLEQLIRGTCHLRLEWIVRDAAFAEQVAELFDFASRHRLSGRLLKELAEYPPPNPKKAKLRPLVEKYPPDPEEPDRLSSELVREAIGAFQEVPGLLNDASIRDRLTPFRSAYEQASVHIELLRRYKGLHDCLHVIQLKYREIAQSAENLSDDPMEASSLNVYADDLEMALTGDGVYPGADQLVSKLPNAARETTWVKNLRRAIEHLRAAAESRDRVPAAEASHLLDRILVRDPDRIHGEILGQFEGIQLLSLVLSLRAIPVESVASAIRLRLLDGLTAFESIHLRFSALIAEHTAWQNLDNSLGNALKSWYEILSLERKRSSDRVLVAAGADDGSHHEAHDSDDSQTVYANRLIEDWPDVAEKFADVRAVAPKERRLSRLIRYAEEIEEAVKTRNFGELFTAFEPFARQSLTQFVSVDKSLLKIADDLTRIADPLKAVLEELQI